MNNPRHSPPQHPLPTAATRIMLAICHAPCSSYHSMDMPLVPVLRGLALGMAVAAGSLAGYGVMAIAFGFMPTRISLAARLVAVLIGVTLPSTAPEAAEKLRT